MRRRITFTADGVPSAICFHDEEPASVSGGYGGWTVTERMRRKGISTWNGVDPLRMAVPVLFDGYQSGTSQEIQISHLSRMALPASSGGEPPVVKITGAGVPKPGPTSWVIETIAWGTSKVIWDLVGGQMVRLRQDAVVNLMQYIGGDRVAFKSLRPASKNNSGTKTGWPKKYTTKAGDTLQKIAAKFYGDSSKWHQIADANNIRDPKSIKPGREITIPAP